MKYIVPKGFVSVDGTSLTICDVDSSRHWFTFMLIEHTQKHVIIPSKAVGEFVNIEVDVLAKMVEKSLDALTERFEKRLQALESRLLK
jgi:riboflavin synthase